MQNNANIKDAIHLIDDEGFQIWGSLMTGWDYNNDGEGPEWASGRSYWLLNSDKDGDVYVRRDCNKFEGGKLTYEILFETVEGSGLYISLGARDDAFLRLYEKDGKLCCKAGEIGELKYGMHFLKVNMDLTASKVNFYLDKKYAGEFDFDKPAFPFECVTVGYGEKDRGITRLYYSKAYVNFLAHDRCLNRLKGKLSEEYKVKCEKGSSVKCGHRVEGKEEYAYISKNKKGTKTVTVRPFAKARGNVVLEMMFLMPEDSNGKITVSLCKGKTEAVSVYDEGTSLNCYCGCSLRNHHKNVWQTLRIYADTEKGCADIRLNGKKTKVVDFENSVKFLDNFKISFEAYEDSVFMFSDMLAWVQPEEPADYVPAPVVPKKKGDYVVGLNICSLWREGYHLGWDKITPFDDVKPVLGYYDEGLPETADWEIKYMVEHGIDYELYCWYASESNAPMKLTHLHHAWIDGHFYSKYGDMEKFALLWELSASARTAGLEGFKKYLVPYWIDYFFSDDRYMRVDNKAIMSMFGVWFLEKDFGDTDTVKEAFDYLREELKKIGYDDLIVMGSHASPERLKELHCDAFHAYNFGPDAYKFEKSVDMVKEHMSKNAVHIIPTVAVGFKNVGWGGDRRPNLSSQDMYKSVKYFIDEILPNNEKGWKSKMLHIATWNEFGEGTYIAPSGLNGFGYLDAIRKAVCVDEPHEDIVPTEAQKDRICYLHRKDRYKLARTKYDVRPLPEKDTVIAKYTFKSEKDLKKWKFKNIADLEIKDGKLCGRATANLPEMELRKAGFDATEIAYAKVVCTNRHGDNHAPTVAYVVPSNSPAKDNYNINHGSAEFWCDDWGLKEYMAELDSRRWWTGTIHGFKFIPTYSGTFELESITLCASLPHVSLYSKSGEQMYFGDYLEVRSGEVYVPFDPESGIMRELGFKYFEWHKEQGTLEMWNKQARITLTVGKAYAEKNGESFTLIRPVYLKDGIPTISLTDIEKIFGIETERQGNKIYIK